MTSMRPSHASALKHCSNTCNDAISAVPLHNRTADRPADTLKHAVHAPSLGDGLHLLPAPVAGGNSTSMLT